MKFIDYKEHLQELLDNVAQDTFVVSNIRDLDTDTEKVSVVFTQLVGNVYEDSATIPYKIEIQTTEPDKVSEIFMALAKQRNGKSFVSIGEDDAGNVKEYTIFEYYQTPTPIDKINEVGMNDPVRLVLFATLNVLFEVGNVSSIKIDGNELEFSTGNLSYAIESFSNRITGEHLNFAVKKASVVNLQLTMVNKTTPFTSKIFDIIFGKASGNTIFECDVKLTNGYSGKLYMILNSNSFDFAKNSPNLPALNIILTNADNDLLGD